MKKYLKPGTIIILLLSVMLTAGAFAGMPLLRTWWAPVQPVIEEEPVRYGKREVGILKELVAVYRRIDTLSAVEMGGSMKTTDPSDPVNDINTVFTYCKKGEQLYYRMGDNEMIQLKDVNISANRGVNKMFVTPPRKIITAPQMPVDSIIALWEDDSYDITATTIDDQVTVTFLCERHVRCKELKITYNRASNKMNSVYMRLTNLSDPLNKKLDRHMSVTFNKWEEAVADNKYFKLSDYLEKEGTTWQPAGSYRQYKLISVL